MRQSSQKLHQIRKSIRNTKLEQLFRNKRDELLDEYLKDEAVQHNTLQQQSKAYMQNASTFQLCRNLATINIQSQSSSTQDTPIDQLNYFMHEESQFNGGMGWKDEYLRHYDLENQNPHLIFRRFNLLLDHMTSEDIVKIKDVLQQYLKKIIIFLRRHKCQEWRSQWGIKGLWIHTHNLHKIIDQKYLLDDIITITLEIIGKYNQKANEILVKYLLKYTNYETSPHQKQAKIILLHYLKQYSPSSTKNSPHHLQIIYDYMKFLNERTHIIDKLQFYEQLLTLCDKIYQKENDDYDWPMVKMIASKLILEDLKKDYSNSMLLEEILMRKNRIIIHLLNIIFNVADKSPSMKRNFFVHSLKNLFNCNKKFKRNEILVDLLQIIGFLIESLPYQF